MRNKPKEGEVVGRQKKYVLVDMLASVNPDNLHLEVEWRPAKGREEW